MGKALSQLYVFTMGLSIASLIIISVLLVAAGLGRSQKDEASKWFFYVVLFDLLSAIPEFIMAGIMSGEGSGRIVFVLLHTLNYSTYVFSVLATFALAKYIFEYLSTKNIDFRPPVRAVTFICGFALIFHAIAEVTNLYSWFDESKLYYKSDLFWLGYVPNVMVFIICFYALIKCRSKLRLREGIFLSIYMWAIVICFALESFNEEVWIAYFGDAVSLLLIYVMIQIEMMQTIQKQNIELEEHRVAIMISQIQPHFLYNALNSIDNLFYCDEEKAHDALYMFAEYLRRNMDSLDKKELIPFEHELRHTRQYLELETLRFKEKLRIEYDIRTENFFIPALTLQPIVENAVRYGASKKRTGGTIQIYTEELKQSYRITVKDDGVGFELDKPYPDDSRSHRGIQNVRERLALMCRGSLHIESTLGEGTTVVIEIPK